MIKGLTDNTSDSGIDVYESRTKSSYQENLDLVQAMRCSLKRSIKKKRGGKVNYTNNFTANFGKLKFTDIPWIFPSEKSSFAVGTLIVNGEDLPGERAIELKAKLFSEYKFSPQFFFEVYYPAKKKQNSGRKPLIKIPFNLGWQRIRAVLVTRFSSGKTNIKLIRKEINDLIDNSNKKLANLPKKLLKAKADAGAGHKSGVQNAEKGLRQRIKIEKARAFNNIVEIQGKLLGQAGYIDANSTPSAVNYYDGFLLSCDSPKKHPTDPEDLAETLEYLEKSISKTLNWKPDFSIIESDFKDRKKSIIYKFDKEKQKLEQRKLATISYNQKMAHEALCLAQDFEMKNRVDKLILSRNSAIVLPDQKVLLGNLLNFKKTFFFQLKYTVRHFPEYGQWKNSIKKPVSYFQIGKKVFSIEKTDETVLVKLMLFPKKASHYSFDLKLIDKQYNKHIVESDKIWKKKLQKINKKVSSFLNSFKGKRVKFRKKLEALKKMYTKDFKADPKVIYTRFGMKKDFDKAIAKTKKYLKKCRLKDLDNIELLWKDLYEKALARVYELASHIDIGKSSKTFAKGSGSSLYEKVDTTGVFDSSGLAGDSSLGNDPETALKKLLERINNHARQAFHAMDFKYDCSSRVKKHMGSLGLELRKMKTILKSIKPSKVLSRDFYIFLKNWANKNAKSQNNLYIQAKKMRGTQIPSISSNLTIAKYRRRLVVQRTKIINMKKVYKVCESVIKQNSSFAYEISKLIR